MIPVETIVDALKGRTAPDGPLVAALPMYDWPERRQEVDAQWAHLRDALHAAGVDAPVALARRNADLPAAPGGIRNAGGKLVAPDPATLPPDELDFEALWQHPNLLVSQTCWGPLELWLGGMSVIAQDDYSGLEGGDGELYSSALVMRKAISPLVGEMSASPAEGGNPAQIPPPSVTYGDISPARGEIVRSFAGLRLAYNVADSMSGYLALQRDLQRGGADLGIFGALLPSGGHRKSIRMVAAGEADIAAIDCKSWDMALRHEPAARALRVIGWTAKRKGLPFITGLPQASA